ncbi:MAG: oxidoreductase [Pseudopedobacter saltans]|uniref:Oxidoreductase n=1 Tax=Pseudopedobacter saltans TaxID=151895 RepID=A0A2W5GVN0_9SPHI|nr:MAG: oxidoreductase [Pseudopedobacter saltans]
MQTNIGVGLIGFGMAGQLFHAPFIRNVNGFSLRKIRTANPEHIQKAKHEYPESEVVSTSESIFEDVDIQLVVIASANTSHFELAKKALEAGKNVVVDKPFTITTSEADELIILAKEKELLLSVYQNRRWSSDFKTLQSVVEKGLVGHIVELEMHYDRFRNQLKSNAWREKNLPGSGILYDLGAHLIDEALVLFGRPKYIWADLAIQRKDAQTIDYFNIILKYSSGLRVKLGAGMLKAQPRPHYILNGDIGSYVKSSMDIQEEHLKAGKRPTDTLDWGQEFASMYGKLVRYENDEMNETAFPSIAGDYTGFYQNIYDTLQQKAALKVQPEEARNVIRIIEMAIESSQERKEVEIKYSSHNIKY